MQALLKNEVSMISKCPIVIDRKKTASPGINSKLSKYDKNLHQNKNNKYMTASPVRKSKGIEVSKENFTLLNLYINDT